MHSCHAGKHTSLPLHSSFRLGGRVYLSAKYSRRLYIHGTVTLRCRHGCSLRTSREGPRSDGTLSQHGLFCLFANMQPCADTSKSKQQNLGYARTTSTQYGTPPREMTRKAVMSVIVDIDFFFFSDQPDKIKGTVRPCATYNRFRLDCPDLRAHGSTACVIHAMPIASESRHSIPCVLQRSLLGSPRCHTSPARLLLSFPALLPFSHFFSEGPGDKS